MRRPPHEVTEPFLRPLPVVERCERGVDRSIAPQCEPEHLFAERRDFGVIGFLCYQSAEDGPSTGVGRCSDDVFREYSVGIIAVVECERNAEVVLRVIQPERLPLQVGRAVIPNTITSGTR